jgi:hypothetical protein
MPRKTRFVLVIGLALLLSTTARAQVEKAAARANRPL